MKRISEEDAALFRAAVRDVKPLAQGGACRRARPSPRARVSRAPTRRRCCSRASKARSMTRAVSGGDELVFRRPGVQPSVVRNLRRGLYRVEAEFDLHGHNVVQAKAALTNFLNEALRARHPLRAHRAWQGPAFGPSRTGAEKCRQHGAAAHRHRGGVRFGAAGRRRHGRAVRAAITLTAPRPCRGRAATPPLARQCPHRGREIPGARWSSL